MRHQPRVLGLVVELLTRRRIFVPILRVTAIAHPLALLLLPGLRRELAPAALDEYLAATGDRTLLAEIYPVLLYIIDAVIGLRPTKAEEEEGAAGKQAEPTPVVAPRPKIELPERPPVAAA